MEHYSPKPTKINELWLQYLCIELPCNSSGNLGPVKVKDLEQEMSNRVQALFMLLNSDLSLSKISFFQPR